MSKATAWVVISALIGAVLGEIVGYILFAISLDLPFNYWVHRPGSHTWAIHGAVLGAGIRWLVVYVHGLRGH
jgi:hypothetical protein